MVIVRLFELAPCLLYEQNRGSFWNFLKQRLPNWSSPRRFHNKIHLQDAYKLSLFYDIYLEGIWGVIMQLKESMESE